MVNQKSCAYTLEEKVEVYHNQKGSYVLLHCIVFVILTYRDPGLVSSWIMSPTLSRFYILQQE